MSAVAAVEIGSVSTKLLVVDGERRIRRAADVVMGGMELSPAGQLVGRPFSTTALEQARRVLRGFAAIASEVAVDEVRVVATAAARLATNTDALAAVVADELEAELRVIDGDEEAALAFAGAVSDRPGGSGPVLTVDIGGGSTEFALGEGPVAQESCSVPIGGLLVSRTYLTSDPPRPEELSAALSVVELHLDDVVRLMPALRPSLETASASVLALGAVTTVAAIEVGRADVDPFNGDGDGDYHGFVLTRDAIEDVFRTIATENAEDRAYNPGLPKSRVDDIVGACAVLAETVRQFDLDEVVVSQRGVLDGVASGSAAAWG